MSRSELELFVNTSNNLRSYGLLPVNNFDAYQALSNFLNDQTFMNWLNGPESPEQLHFTQDTEQKLLALSGEHAYAVYKMLKARKDAST